MSTKIEWCQETWNPITGCSKISEGCKNCYAERMSKRLAGRYGYPKHNPFAVTFHPDRLDQPLKWKKPKRIFVCSMGDLFHEKVSEYDILAIWQRMGEFHDLNGQIAPVEKRPGHTYLVLTKRPERALDFLSRRYPKGFERSNVWIGVTCENQQAADERIPILLQIPAAVRFVSCEPLLGEIDFSHLPESGAELDWVITGGESGPGARPMHPDWARSIRGQCQAAGVPFFFKQWGAWTGAKGWYLQDNMASCKSMIVDKDIEDKIGISMGRVGKKKAGRILDGRTWGEYPQKENL